MTLEEAKWRLLNPPPEAYRRPVLERNAPWLVLGAFVGGFFLGNPGRLMRLGTLGFSLAASPMARKALLPLVLSAAARRGR